MGITQKLETAEELINNEQYDEAVLLLTGIIEQNSSSYEALILRGSTYSLMSETEKATTDLLKAAEIGEEPDMAYWYLSQIYVTKADLLTAREYIIKAIELNEENYQYVGDYIVIEQGLHNYEKSIELCNKMLDYYPADTFALYNRGFNNLCLKRYDEAVSDFERLLLEQPNHYIALNNLGHIYSRTGQNAKAIKYLLAAVHIEPDFAYSHNNLGYAYYLENNYESAIKSVDRSIELDAENPKAYRNRALVLIAQNEKEKAKNDLNEAKELGYQDEYDNEMEELLSKV